MKLAKYAALALAGVSFGQAAVAAERPPTQAEMRSAMDRRLNAAISTQASQGQRACQSMNSGNSQNPLDALACAMMGGQAGAMARNITISYFEKISCRKAVASGYTCDYLINANAPMMGGFNPDNGSPVTGTKRFVQSARGWIALDR